MKKYRIEITEAENTYCYNGEWDSDCIPEPIEAENENEAIELAKEYINENGGKAENYIYRAKE